MKFSRKPLRFLFLVAIAGALLPPCRCEAKLAPISRDPYIGNIVADADTGTIIAEDNADAIAYPASIVKLMDLLIVMEKIDQGKLKLTDMVKITSDAAKMGGTQSYLDPRESFAVDDLLYSLMVSSANDAAVALAIHIAGTKDAFVGIMNKRAKALGMNSTVFHSVHGLPPGAGQKPDVTTARDMLILAREVLKHPDILRYTSTQRRELKRQIKIKNETTIMETHNYLLGKIEGCDGLKTGYFTPAGFSIVATAKRNGRRVVAVVMGSKVRQTRDRIATELIAKGFLNPPTPRPPTLQPLAATNIETKINQPETKSGDANRKRAFSWRRVGIATGATLLAFWVVGAIVMRRSRVNLNRPYLD